MSDFTLTATNTSDENQVGPNMNGTGNFHVNNGSKTLSMYYDPKGDAQVLYGVNNGSPRYELPKRTWVTFSSSVYNVYLSFSAGQGSANDFKVAWNIS
jgi:hypothetical protein